MHKLRPIGLSTAAAAICLMVAALSTAQAPPAPAPPPALPPSLPPTHVVDLMTAQGSAAVAAQWKVMDVKIVEVPAIRGALPQYKSTYDIDPHAGEGGFDDSRWPTIEATDLGARRGGGRVSFVWYRTKLTMPGKIGDFETSGAQAVLRVVVDDYAEVWVDGQLPRRPGYPSPATIQGFNAPNRILLGTSVREGDKFQIAIFGVNGPISASPTNTVWFREAKLEFYK